MKSSFVTCLDDVSELPRHADALFIINQEITAAQIASLAREHGFARLVVVSTHAPFPSECEQLERLIAPARLWWVPMSWLLTDAEMAECDDRAVAELSVGGQRIDGPAVVHRSRSLRNERAAERLCERLRAERCFAAEGLGVVASAWSASITLSSGPTPLPGVARRGPLARLSALRQFLKLELVDDENERYAFLGHTRRLRFREGVRVKTVRASLIAALLRGSGTSVRRRLATGAVASLDHGRGVYVATTVHNFAPWMLDAFPDLRVFVDGLHPPNYPVSYGAAYRDALIVSREACDREWFEACGCTVLPPPRILADERPYGDPSSRRPIRNVSLMLNHAGDWSALIDRSDTDLIVMAFADAAARAPEFEFRVRAHPTMGTPEHEGVRSFDRLKNWVLGLGLGNLQFSTGAFDEDMAWTDCCVSEYSNVLVDAMKAGKACIALNPTNRRNLLAHLEPLGLREVRDGSALVEWLRHINRPAAPSSQADVA